MTWHTQDEVDAVVREGVTRKLTDLIRALMTARPRPRRRSCAASPQPDRWTWIAAFSKTRS
jgi:hypothetical protein